MPPSPKATRQTTTTRAGRWPPETQARALDLYTTEGLAAAHHELGIPKSTIRGWAKQAGLETAAARARSVEQTRAATEASVARRASRLAEVREELVEQVGEAALQALQLERALLSVHAKVVSAAAEGDGLVPANLTGLLSAAMSGHRLSEVIGSRTRAVHDLLRLTGGDGDQPVDGGLVIVFATPAPAPGPAGPVIIDLPPSALEA